MDLFFNDQKDTLKQGIANFLIEVSRAEMNIARWITFGKIFHVATQTHHWSYKSITEYHHVEQCDWQKQE